MMHTAEEARIQSAYARRKASVPSSRYSSFDPANLLGVQELERALLKQLARHRGAVLESSSICEVGCGAGFWLREFIKWGAQPENLAGIDLLPERIARARLLCPTSVQLECGNAQELPWRDSSFDIVMQFVVFTSILDGPTRQRVAGEMLRVLKPGGMILWYDFHMNNPRNPDVRGVKKREIRALFPGCRIELGRITLAPPLSRRLAPWSPLLCALLTKVPLLCTHYLGVVRRNRAQASV